MANTRDRLAAMRRELRRTQKAVELEARNEELKSALVERMGYKQWPGWVSVHNTMSCIAGNGLSVKGGLPEGAEERVEVR